MTMTCAGDRWKKPATAFGFLVLAIIGGIMLFLPKDRQPANGVIYVCLVIGAGAISPGLILDALRVWRGASGTPPPPPET